MKGTIFIAFCAMVEKHFSPEMLDDIIEATKPESRGAYTTVGKYPHGEILNYVVELNRRTDIPIETLVKTFGQYLFGHLARGHQQMMDKCDGAMDFLYTLETKVHTQVRKLYPDASLPQFDCAYDDSGALIMDYRSERPMADLAEGLIEASIAHFGGTVLVERQDVPGRESFEARFTLRETGRNALMEEMSTDKSDSLCEKAVA